MKGFDFLKLGFNDEDKKFFEEDMINYKKQMNRLLSDARKAAKKDKCYYCRKDTSSFCNSHSIPAFILKNIATNGNLLYSSSLTDLPLIDYEKGVNNSGTFHIICRECDKNIFKEYENPDNYKSKPNTQMIAQIAMKNCLKLISKRLNENELYGILKSYDNSPTEFANSMQKVNNLDLKEFEENFNKARIQSKRKDAQGYYLFYYEELEYVVPIAFQNSVSLIVDLEGNIINDIYYQNPKYKIQDIHICIFPLENTSIIMMFMDEEHKRYRQFYKQLNNLSKEDQLSVINYIVFLYSEDIFLSKQIDEEILSNENLKNVSKQIQLAIRVGSSNSNVIEEAKEVYDLSKRNKIPNLLSKEYKLR